MDVEVREPSVFGNSSTKQVVKKLLKAYESSEYAARAISKVQQITAEIVYTYLIIFVLCFSVIEVIHPIHY
jgi:hypothetical protein